MILKVEPLGFPWETPDPFLFCVHHDDAYRAGNEDLGPAASLDGRALGQDFAGKDGWRMYHGLRVPGFPQHPHRGFETVTVVRRGLIDHSDSLGATARYGDGDVQWLTAGRGINHAEMFPLLDRSRQNPLELFQIWLNLPRASKMVDPHFTMFWNAQVPRVEAPGVQVTVVAGALGDAKPPAPPPESWASSSAGDVAIWTLKLGPGARWTMPAALEGVNRSLYFFRGEELRAGGRKVPAASRLQVSAAELELSSESGAELLLLQGRPIREPVVQYGPFVMNTRQEIAETFAEYQRTQFGGWPWTSDDPVHARDQGRFARRPDGRIERP
jgi:redox-sensitive bicupin YhaK (pirin superfamily)